MPRYIENLNECTDPTSGDFLWIVDASASASDKDRKVDVGKFPRLAVANTFTGNVTIDKASPSFNVSGSGQGLIAVSAMDNGSSMGGLLSADRNNNGSTPAAGVVRMKDRADTWRYVWPDNTGNLRIGTSQPTNANDTSGTVVGTQTSNLASKTLHGAGVDLADVLAAVQRGAEAVRRFTYKSGAFNGETFEGLVTDFAPRYGMDRDAQHPAGKSLNEVTVIGDLLRAVAWLIQREQERAADED